MTDSFDFMPKKNNNPTKRQLTMTVGVCGSFKGLISVELNIND